MEKVKKSLVKKEYLVPFVLVTSLFFLWGFAHAILDVLNKHFQEALVMTKAHSALIQVKQRCFHNPFNPALASAVVSSQSSWLISGKRMRKKIRATDRTITPITV